MAALFMAGATRFGGSLLTRAVVAALLTVGLVTSAAPAHANTPGDAAEPPNAAPLMSPAELGYPTAAKASKLTLQVDQTGPGTVTVSGQLKNAEGAGISGPISIAVDGRTLGVVTSAGDGSYGAQVPGIPDGRHMATATFDGGPAAGPASARSSFTVTPASAPAPQAPAPGPAQKQEAPAPAPSDTVITAKVTPTTATPGSAVEVSGTLLTSANVPVNQARIEVTSSWANLSAVGATTNSGAFSVLVGLPALAEGEAPPASITVVVTYPGDGPYSGTKSSYRVALKAADPTPPPPSIRVETPAPPAEKATSTTSAAPATSNLANVDVSGATSRGVAVLVFVLAVGAVTALAGMGAVAWRRNQLLPGERRGFGTDFGK